MTTSHLLPILLLLIHGAPLRTPAPARVAPTSEGAQMKKLDFLLGKWAGTVYVEYVPGQRDTFTETETVQVKLGGLLITVEGTGKSKMPNGEEAVTHSAFAAVSYDQSASAYRWHAYNAARGSVQYLATTAKVGTSTLEWGYRDRRAGSVQFTIRTDQQGRWSETGELSHDGKTWHKFFAMTLRRIN
ncbi:MAG: hypothetical protein ACRD2B_17310 [Terriglobia bacterium]